MPRVELVAQPRGRVVDGALERHERRAVEVNLRVRRRAEFDRRGRLGRAVGRARGLVAYPQLVSLKVGAWTLATHDGSRPVADVLGSCDGVVVDVLGDVKEVPKESGAVLAAASARLAALAAPKKRVPPIAAAGVDDDDFPFVSPSPTHRVLPGFEAPARPKKQQDFDGGDALAALVSPPSDARPTPAFA